MKNDELVKAEENYVFTQLPYETDGSKKPLAICKEYNEKGHINGFSILCSIEKDSEDFYYLYNFGGKEYRLLVSEKRTLHNPKLEDISHIIENSESPRALSEGSTKKLFELLYSDNYTKISPVGCSNSFLNLYLSDYDTIYYSLEILYNDKQGGILYTELF